MLIILVSVSGFLKKYVPKVKTGHVAPDISLDRVKSRLAEVRGSLVECPLVSNVFDFFSHFVKLYCANHRHPQDFLIDQKDLVDNPDWIGLNPTLPIYI